MMNPILRALFISSLSVISARAQIIVQCRASVECNGAPGDDLGMMTDRECCIDNPNGLAYSINTTEGSESCTPCIVFGFLRDSFSGIEQGPGHMVEVGYQKGAAQAGVNLIMNVVSIPGTAREGSGFDYTINTVRARILFQPPDQFDNVVFTFRVDTIAQEANETLDLQLVPIPGVSLPSSDSFFRNTLNMTIIDSDTVQISFTEDDYRANEQNLRMPVRVTKDVQIANPIELDVVPLTVQQARENRPLLLPQNIPEDNSFSPPFADLNDFNNTVLRIIFEADENLGVNDMSAPVAIFDDPINEAAEQAFIVQLKLISSTNPGLIDLNQRPASLCRIVDNDPIRIGFELSSYTFLEPEFDEAIDQFYITESGLPINGPVYLAKENNVTTEQTFQIITQISNVAPPGQGIEPATPDEDYIANQVSIVPFPPTDQRLVFQFSLLADDVPEVTEAFQVGSTPNNQPGMPIFLASTMLFQQTFIVIQDDDVVPIVIGFEETQYNVGEFAGFVEVFVSVFMPAGDQMLVGGVSLLIQSVSGSAVGGEDYIEINAITLDQLLDFSDTNRRLSFNVTIINDNLSEMRENFSLELRFDTFLGDPPSGVTLSPNITTITIEDDDTGVPFISFEKESDTVDESDGYVEVCFSTNAGHTDPISVTITPVMKGVDAPAASDSDFDSRSRMQTFEAASTGSMLCVNITIIEDSIYEDDEQFLVTFGNLPNSQAGVGPITQTCITIRDDDVPEFNIGPTTSVNESTPDVEICVSTSNSLGRNVTVTAVTGPKNGTTNQATADLDYDSTTVLLIFMPSDEGTQTLCFNVSIMDDLLGNEPDEEFSVAISDTVPAGSVGDNAEACVTIIDNDTPEVQWETPEISIPEGQNETVCFITNIGTATPYNVVISACPMGQNSSSSDDYNIPQASLMTTVPVSEDGSSFCINLFTVDDTMFEADEQFEIVFQNLPSEFATVGDIDTVCVTIVDDDGIPRVSFDKESYTMDESDGYVEVCFFTNTGHADPINVTITPVMKGVDAPAASDSDFDSRSRMQTFEATSTGSTLCVNITIIEDSIYEDDEQFLVIFGNLPNSQAGVGPITQTCITIRDDDVPEFNIGPTTSVNESTPDVEICVSTSNSLGRNVTVTAVTGPKSEATNQTTADMDYVSTTVMLTFMPSDEGTQTLCFNVSIIDDLLGNEPDEEFSVTISDTVPAGSVGDNAEACVTIIDDDTPEVEWVIPNVTIPEGRNETFCFTTNIGTAMPYDVMISARPKGQSPASSDDYDLPQASRMIIVPVSENGSLFCIDLLILEDSMFEDDEQFELFFQNLPSEFATVGDIDTVCVTITDNDAPTTAAPTTPPPPSDVMTCRITEPLRVQPYTRTSMYGFMGTCEHIATSSCETIQGFDVRVTVDFLTESLGNGAVGLHVNNSRYVSREDGSYDDGGQTPVPITLTSHEYAATGSTLVRVSFGTEQTNITYTDPRDPLVTIIEIVHTYGGESPFIQISIQTPNNSVISDFCGLCGSRSGSLLKRDGTVANMMNMTQVQGFAQSYLVEPRDQILRPQRRECGTIRNDTVIGDPLYAAPVYSEDGKEYSLCYEVFGRANSTFNLVSDTCVNVNARYGSMDNPEEGNIIRAVGVRARGLNESSCHNIHVDLEGCSATVEMPDGNSQSLASMERFENDGISVRKYPRRVRISAPNCENVMLVMWVICENVNNQDMIKFVIARGVNLRPSSHGLLGQFWNIPVTFVKYTGNDTDLPPDMLEEKDNFYIVTVQPWANSSPSRSFLGLFYTQKWDNSAGPCLYVGNAQGGPSSEVKDPNDSVIEGDYFDYRIPSGDIFETAYKFAQFDEKMC